MLVVAAVLLATFFLGRASAVDGRAALGTARAGRDGAPGTTAVVVRPGDTLWSLARRIAPGDDPRVTIDWLRRSNHLGGSGLEVGTVVVVPQRR